MRYPSNQGGALARFARLAARCRPSQTRHCRRVVRLGANTLHGTRAACPKRPRAAADGDAATPRKTPRPPRRPGKGKGSFEENAPPGPTPPHAASRTLFRTKKSVRSDAHYVGRTGLRLSPVGQGGALARFARPAARCRPSQTRHCRRVVRLGANTLHGTRAACPKRPRAAADGDAATPRKTPRPPRRPGKGKGSFEENAPPGPTPPHAASRTLFRTKKSVRSDAHYVGRTGLRLSPVGQGGALPRFARPAARCRPRQPRGENRAPPPSPPPLLRRLEFAPKSATMKP